MHKAGPVCTFLMWNNQWHCTHSWSSICFWLFFCILDILWPIRQGTLAWNNQHVCHNIPLTVIMKLFINSSGSPSSKLLPNTGYCRQSTGYFLHSVALRGISCVTCVAFGTFLCARGGTAGGAGGAVILPPASGALQPQRKNDHSCHPPWLTGLGIYFCYQRSQHEESTPPRTPQPPFPSHSPPPHTPQPPTALYPFKRPPRVRTNIFWCYRKKKEKTQQIEPFFSFSKESMNNSFLYQAAFILFKRKRNHKSLLIMDDIDQDVDGGIR